MINLASFFSTTILVTTISTLVLAIAAYFAYKLREWRKPKFLGENNSTDETLEPIFLKRHMLSDISPDERAGTS